VHAGKLYHLREISLTGGEALPSKPPPQLAAPARADITAQRDRPLNAVLFPYFAGTATKDMFASFNEQTQFAGDLGFRYHSAIGPIRSDFAVPLNPRKRDDPVAFYISIGLPF
jgi:outer membrane protein assembly factor BamA